MVSQGSRMLDMLVDMAVSLVSHLRMLPTTTYRRFRHFLLQDPTVYQTASRTVVRMVVLTPASKTLVVLRMTMDSTTEMTAVMAKMVSPGQLSEEHPVKITLPTVPFPARVSAVENSSMLGTTVTWTHSAKSSTFVKKTADTTRSCAPTAPFSTRGSSCVIGGTTSSVTKRPLCITSTPSFTSDLMAPALREVPREASMARRNHSSKALA